VSWCYDLDLPVLSVFLKLLLYLSVVSAGEEVLQQHFFSVCPAPARSFSLSVYKKVALSLTTLDPILFFSTAELCQAQDKMLVIKLIRMASGIASLALVSRLLTFQPAHKFLSLAVRSIGSARRRHSIRLCSAHTTVRESVYHLYVLAQKRLLVVQI
jgi:hypothetical protein